MNIGSCFFKKALWLVFFCLVCVSQSLGQDQYKLHISSIETPEAPETSWYGRPLSTNYLVSWDLYQLDEENKPVRKDVSAIPKYHLFCAKDDSTFQLVNIVRDMVVQDTNQVLFAGFEVGPRYYFRIDGITDDGGIVQSDTAWIVSGKPRLLASFNQETNEAKKSFPIPIFFPLSYLLDKVFGYQNEIYEHSTIFGKLAFTLIWWFALFGIVYVLPFRCIRHLRISSIIMSVLGWKAVILFIIDGIMGFPI